MTMAYRLHKNRLHSFERTHQILPTVFRFGILSWMRLDWPIAHELSTHAIQRTHTRREPSNAILPSTFDLLKKFWRWNSSIALRSFYICRTVDGRNVHLNWIHCDKLTRPKYSRIHKILRPFSAFICMHGPNQKKSLCPIKSRTHKEILVRARWTINVILWCGHEIVIQSNICELRAWAVCNAEHNAETNKAANARIPTHFRIINCF